MRRTVDEWNRLQEDIRSFANLRLFKKITLIDFNQSKRPGSYI